MKMADSCHYWTEFGDKFYRGSAIKSVLNLLKPSFRIFEK